MILEEKKLQTIRWQFYDRVFFVSTASYLVGQQQIEPSNTFIKGYSFML